ncbi:proton-conducting transporter transmembrane domain-containing protein [Halorussus ruber]|uniref:proton-conducting transporter transmembrane domain-containing protein n=1 Tax=Halorussus ruber TaxID=1126238 RepID=UPI001092F9B6|nr:proton-conducting transporter membrane subunit [Halorussus ruber]
MTEVTSLRPALAVLIPALAAVAVLVFGGRPNVRESWTMLAAIAELVVVGTLAADALAGRVPTTVAGTFATGIPLAVRADALGALFASIAAVLWVVASVYSVGYMRKLDEHDQSRFFAAFAASIASAMGVALAANLLTLFVAYELLTVATYPLVAHAGTEEARRSGRKYARYAFGGGVAVLGGTVLVYALAGSVTFTPGGLAALGTADPLLAEAAFGLLAAGFGVKAAVMPVHGWLPDAMVAPTPVSALLHAVAVVKSGVFGIARVILFVFGPEAVRDSALRWPLAGLAAATMILAGFLALRQDKLKRVLAYSTTSQLSFMVLGLTVLTPTAVLGALFHLVTHAFMKITAFFCAGTIYVETEREYVSQMAGIARRLPATLAAFSIAAAGLVGVPLVGGFVSEWYLVLGTLAGPIPPLAAAFWLAAFVKLLFFWPIVSTAVFEREQSDREWTRPEGLVSEAAPTILGPILFTAGVAVLLGVVPTATPFFELAEEVVAEVFGP